MTEQSNIEIEKTETEKRELFPEAIFGEKDYLSELFGLEPHDIRTRSEERR